MIFQEHKPDHWPISIIKALVMAPGPPEVAKEDLTFSWTSSTLSRVSLAFWLFLTLLEYSLLRGLALLFHPLGVLFLQVLQGHAPSHHIPLPPLLRCDPVRRPLLNVLRKEAVFAHPWPYLYPELVPGYFGPSTTPWYCVCICWCWVSSLRWTFHQVRAHCCTPSAPQRVPSM